MSDEPCAKPVKLPFGFAAGGATFALDVVRASSHGDDAATLSLGGELVPSSEDRVTIRIGKSEFSIDRRDVHSLVHTPGPGNYAVAQVSVSAQLVQRVTDLTGRTDVRGVYADGPTCNCVCACNCACACACACACSEQLQAAPAPVTFRVALR